MSDAAVLAEHAAWVRELEAERVTHDFETFAQVLDRLDGERFPDTRMGQAERRLMAAARRGR